MFAYFTNVDLERSGGTFSSSKRACFPKEIKFSSHAVRMYIHTGMEIFSVTLIFLIEKDCS